MQQQQGEEVRGAKESLIPRESEVLEELHAQKCQERMGNDSLFSWFSHQAVASLKNSFAECHICLKPQLRPKKLPLHPARIAILLTSLLSHGGGQ